MNDGKQMMKDVDRLRRQISVHLQGKGPDLQGAVLADLVSMYIAGHHPAIREEAIEVWVKAMRELIEVNEAALFKHYGGRPEGWDPN